MRKNYRLLIPLFAMLLILPGCLTVEQRQRVAEIQAETQIAANTIAELQPTADRLKTLIQGITADFAAGKLPRDKFLELSALYQEQYSVVVQKIADLQKNYTTAQAQTKQLESEGVPWYTIAGSILLNIVLAGAGIYLKKGGTIKDALIEAATSKAKTESLKVQSCVTGLEEAKDDLAAFLKSQGVDDAIIQKIADNKILTKAITNEAILNSVETQLHADVRALT